MLTVIGESLVDIIRHPSAANTETHPGGSPMNVAVGCSRLGLDTTLVTLYAGDANGDLIHEHLTSNGVTVVNDRSVAESSRAIATINAEGAADYTFEIDWHLDAAAPELLAAVASATHVHIGSIAAILEPGASTVFDIVSGARAASTVSYDPNCRPDISGDAVEARRVAESFVAISDVVKASDEDVAWMYPELTLTEVIAAWVALGPSLVIITRGADGPLLSTGRDSLDATAPRITVVDTVGAGDSFMAALIARLDSRGLLGVDARGALGAIDADTLADLAGFATRAAAITCSRAGANPPWSREL